MRKPAVVLAAALVVSLGVSLASRPAYAGCGHHCPGWLDAIGATLAAGLVGGYVGGTGYFVYRDATDEQPSRDYATAELGFNGVFAALYATGTVHAVRDGSAGGAAVFGALALGHGALAAHGAGRLYQLRGEIHVDARTAAAFAALGYASNTLLWAVQAPGRHGRAYGVAEAAVNAPLAAGLGYLAVDRAREGDTRYAALFGGMAAVSGALALHGAYTAVFQRRGSGADLDFGLDLELPADVAPTVVSDGRSIAPGLGASGTW